MLLCLGCDQKVGSLWCLGKNFCYYLVWDSRFTVLKVKCYMLAKPLLRLSHIDLWLFCYAGTLIPRFLTWALPVRLYIAVFFLFFTWLLCLVNLFGGSGWPLNRKRSGFEQMSIEDARSYRSISSTVLMLWLLWFCSSSPRIPFWDL